MERIGVRELRQNASKYLKRVESGETIEISDRGRPVARMVPIASTGMARLIAEGRVQLPESNLLDLGPPLPAAARGDAAVRAHQPGTRRVSRDVVYLDSSAVVKLVSAEQHSEALGAWLIGRASHSSSALAKVEVLRAVRSLGSESIARAHLVLRGLYLVAVDERLLDAAAVLDPAVLRSFDAIHLAAARTLGSDLEVVVSYDQRMLDGARLLGLPTASPT